MLLLQRRTPQRAVGTRKAYVYMAAAARVTVMDENVIVVITDNSFIKRLMCQESCDKEWSY